MSRVYHERRCEGNQGQHLFSVWRRRTDDHMPLCLQLTCRVGSPERTVTHKVLLIPSNDVLFYLFFIFFWTCRSALLLFQTSGHHHVRAREGWDAGGETVKVIHSHLRKRVCDASFVTLCSIDKKNWSHSARVSIDWVLCRERASYS